MNKAALIGKNIAYSYSKIIHSYIAKKYSLDYEYEVNDNDQLENKSVDAFKHEYLFLNITIPYKEEIIKYTDVLDENAKNTNAVNLLHFDNNKAKGYNTDLDGFSYLVRKNNIDFSNKKILILGSGCSARTIYYFLKEYKNNIHFAVREGTRHHIASDNIIIYEEIKYSDFDIVINTTPFDSNLDSDIFSDDTLNNMLIDLNYNPDPTYLMQYFKSSISGIDMLIYQAYKAVEIVLSKKLPAENDIEEIKKLI